MLRTIERMPSGRKWTAVYREGGVRLSRDETTDIEELEITLSVIRRRFGDKITAHMCRALGGVNRLSSLAQLSILNKGDGERTPARARNLHTIAMLMVGVMRELARVLSDLRGAGIRAIVRDDAPWTILDEIRKRWLRDPPSQMRNQVAFHLGDKGGVLPGLERLQALSDRVPLYQIERSSAKQAQVVEAHYPLGDRVLMASVGLTNRDVSGVIEDLRKDGARVARALHNIWIDLLNQCGARLSG